MWHSLHLGTIRSMYYVIKIWGFRLSSWLVCHLCLWNIFYHILIQYCKFIMPKSLKCDILIVMSLKKFFITIRYSIRLSILILLGWFFLGSSRKFFSFPKFATEFECCLNQNLLEGFGLNLMFFIVELLKPLALAHLVIAWLKIIWKVAR